MIYRAKIVLPVETQPIPDGAILVQGERIADVGPFEILRGKYPGEKVFDFKNAVVVPGLINLHSHIELEVFADLARPRDFVDWIGEILKRSRRMKSSDWLRSARRGAARLISGGITATADISRWGAGAVAMREFGLRGIAFHEFVGVTEDNLEEAERDLLDRIGAVRPSALLKIGVSPHSTYSLARKALLRSIAIAERMSAPIAVHVAETREEVELVKRGTGALADAMKGLLGKRTVQSMVAGESPASYLKSLGALGEKTIAVHCVHVGDDDLEKIRDAGSAVVLCPTSNFLLGAGEPPISAIEKSGARRGLGTDSAASNPHLDLFEEMRAYGDILRRQSEGSLTRTADSLLEMVTKGAAAIIGFQGEIGSLAPGKMADFVALDASGRDEEGARRVANWAGREHVVATAIGGRIAYRRSF